MNIIVAFYFWENLQYLLPKLVLWRSYSKEDQADIMELIAQFSVLNLNDQYSFRGVAVITSV